MRTEPASHSDVVRGAAGSRPDKRSDGRLLIRGLDQPGDLGWVVMAHGEIYAREFGWDSRFEALVAEIVADYGGQHDSAREAAWIAEIDGERAGCVFCVTEAERIAKLRLLLVDPAVRGRSLGTDLVRTCVDFARRAGYEEVTLWTNGVLTSARRIYEAAGFRLVDQQSHDSFGQSLVGQDWKCEL